ncbi:hypothetical protein OPT61_g745 [Boeremia exigua]|uniref:Uncharacterized protein n=1 Tax=Boeremia exigua TaxID=749465 RepID=A0ACC2ISV2_9PLEO|nr:hypothetical protein OPT61_g745 [Boeremia exigua]
MVRPVARRNVQAIDLTSDESDGFADDDAAHQDAESIGQPVYEAEELPLDENPHGHADTDSREIIDLTAIPDVDVPPSEHGSSGIEDAEQTNIGAEAELISEAMCLQLVLDVFPDISVDHVLTMIQEKTTNLTRTKEDGERIVNELLEGDFPKEADVKSKKRRREDSGEPSDYETDKRDVGTSDHQDAIDLLLDEFPDVPGRHIINTFRQHKTLFKTYIVLEGQLRRYQHVARTFAKPARPRKKRGTALLLIESESQLPKELHAAKKRVDKDAVKRRKLEETKQAEETNLQQARIDKTMGECQCCFTESPLNRMISCSGKDMHLFCTDCPKQYIETEMGQSKCRPVCFASTECQGTFSRAQLQQILDNKTFERLEHMQQQQDIAAAGLDFLSECPFCDFKAELPPVEIDKEFRCQNVNCGKTSCRLCNKETHIPLSCKEAKKDGQISLRHVVEEAMSAALIRKCNKCQTPFIKELGCNKMSCTKCGNKQCYLCSKNVESYRHFGDPDKGCCELHDNVEAVHEQAVKKAAEEAMAQVRAENPDVSDADLMVQVSNRVKRAEAARKERAGERLNEFPYEMLGGELAHRHGAAGQPQRLVFQFGHAVGEVDRQHAAAVEQPRFAHILNHMEAVGPQGVQQGVAPQPGFQFHGHPPFQDAMNPPAPIDRHAQAAHRHFQHQLLAAANRGRRAQHVERIRPRHEPQNVGRVIAGQGAQAPLNMPGAPREVGRHRLQQRHQDLERLARQMPNEPPLPEVPAMPARPAHGVGRRLPNGHGANADAGVGGGLAFGGLDVNRALRDNENWLAYQQRHLPGQ